MFQVTPNAENFQARYIIRHPATGNLSCESGKKYLQDLKTRRKKELKELTTLTGKGLSNWDEAAAIDDEVVIPGAQYAALLAGIEAGVNEENESPVGMLLVGVLLMSSAVYFRWKGIV